MSSVAGLGHLKTVTGVVIGVSVTHGGTRLATLAHGPVVGMALDGKGKGSGLKHRSAGFGDQIWIAR